MKYFSDLRKNKDRTYKPVEKNILKMIKSSVSGSEFEEKTKNLWRLEDNVLMDYLFKMGYDAAVFSLDNMFLGHIAYQYDATEKNKVNLFSFYVVPIERGNGWPYKFTEDLIKNLRNRGVQKINIGKQGNRLITRLVSRLKNKQQDLGFRLNGNLAYLL